METRSFDIDRRKYPNWLRHGPPMARPIMTIQVPRNSSPAQVDLLKQHYLEKGYHIVLRPEGMK